MTTISVSKLIEVSLEDTWPVISNRDGERNCWPSIRSIDNVIGQGSRRQVSTIFGFKFIEAIDMKYHKSMTVHILEGHFIGAKTIALKPMDGGKGIIAEISWNIRFNKMMRIISPLVKRYIASQTRNALERMAAEASQSKQLKRNG